jgi:hypothetical protein
MSRASRLTIFEEPLKWRSLCRRTIRSLAAFCPPSLVDEADLRHKDRVIASPYRREFVSEIAGDNGCAVH